jgi:hypothetical protein
MTFGLSWAALRPSEYQHSVTCVYLQGTTIPTAWSTGGVCGVVCIARLQDVHLLIDAQAELWRGDQCRIDGTVPRLGAALACGLE